MTRQWIDHIRTENERAITRMERLNKWRQEPITPKAYEPGQMEQSTIRFKKWIKGVFTLDRWIGEGFGA